MYDRIKIRLNRNMLPSGYDWRSVLNRVEARSFNADGNGGKGNWRHGCVVVREDYVQFDGSLPKCLYGHSLVSLNLSEVKGLIGRMSEDLSVPMSSAEVLSLEFAHNFIVKNPPVKYLDMLISIPKFKDNSWDGTRYFEMGGVKVKLYDKVKEARKKRELPKYGDVPPYQLRFEVTFGDRNLKSIFGRQLRAGELCDKSVFWPLVSEWLGYYEKIERRPHDSRDIDFSIFNSVKDFDKWVICTLNDRQSLSSHIKYNLFKNRMNPGSRDRILHRQIQKRIEGALAWGREHLPGDDLMGELSRCMEEYAGYLLNMSPDALSDDEYRKMFG